MKLFLLVALIGAAVANHVPGHVEYPYFLARHAEAASELPTVLTESIMDQPVVVVTRTTRLAPELVAILVEQGINNMPESLESFHDVVRSAETGEFTLCNGGLSGAVEHCVEKPITKLLVPETYKDLTVTRLMNEMPAMPWVRMPFLTRSLVPSTLAEMEVFDKPILIVRAIPAATAAVAPHEIVADSIPLRSLYNAPHLSNLYSKYFTDDSVLKSYSPQTRSFASTGFPFVKSAFLPKYEDTIIDSEVAKPLEYYTSNIYSPSYYKSLNKFDLVRNIKPVFKSFDTVIDKPFLKNYITKPYYRNYDDFIAKPVLKSHDQVIAKPFYKNYDDVIVHPVLKKYDDIFEKPTFKVYSDDIIAKPFVRDFANVHPFYKSFHLVDTPASVLPVTKSSSFFLPKADYETLY